MDPQAIEQFKSITNTNDSVAKFYLESAGGDFEMAITNYFSNAESGAGGETSFTDDDGDVNMTPQATPISSVPSSGGGRTLGGTSVPSSNQPTTSSTSGSSNSKKPVTSSGGGRKIASIRDLNSGEDEKPNSKDNKYYAGGSRNSGQQIIGANDSDDDDDDNHFADKVFKAAQERGAKTRSEYDDELRQNKPKFEGSGRRLGNTEESSNLIQAEQKKKEKEVTITFWADGFTVDDGPLRLYDDPQNVQFMEAINRGFAPRELAEPGVDIAVNLLNRKTDKWAEQPKQFKAFVGSGRSLGAPTSSASSSSSSSSSVPKTTVSSSSSSNLKVEVDNNKPTTSLQIRLADGGRLVGKFNLTHTIGHIRQYIKQSKPSADFDIMTQFPNKVLTDDHLTIEEAGLKGATIIQKLK